MEKFIQLTFSAPSVFLLTAISLFVYMSVWGLAAIRKNRGDLADIAWGLGFLLVAWISFLLSPFSMNALIVNILITAWSLRLAIHISLRNRNRKEDFRYQNLRKNGEGNQVVRLFFQVFMLQGALLYIIALPIVWINTHAQNLSLNHLLGIAPFWLGGFLIETIGDYHLLCFRQNSSNRGKLLTTGLWSYVRHPNYLGEIIQWWAIWALTLSFPLLISPLLLTFLIVKVSGIAPLEEKMKHHPDFPLYAKTTPSLIPFPLVNGSLYTIAWFTIVYYGAKGSFLIPLVTFALTYTVQIILFSRYDKKSLFVSLPLSCYALVLGLVQETVLISFHLIEYPNSRVLPPFWLLSLYPLFSETLNSSLSFLNRSLILSFFLGGFGSLLSYLTGQKLGGVHLVSLLTYPLIFLSWGLYLTFLVFLNRKLNSLREKYTDLERNGKTLTVFFDDHCPVCSREMELLKKRKQTGKIVYACPQSEEDIQKMTQQFTYQQAMDKIHALTVEQEVLTGIDVLSELYARTNLPWMAIFLQAPGFRTFFTLCYGIWAKLRIYL